MSKEFNKLIEYKSQLREIKKLKLKLINHVQPDGAASDSFIQCAISTCL